MKWLILVSTCKMIDLLTSIVSTNLYDLEFEQMLPLFIRLSFPCYGLFYSFSIISIVSCAVTSLFFSLSILIFTLTDIKYLQLLFLVFSLAINLSEAVIPQKRLLYHSSKYIISLRRITIFHKSNLLLLYQSNLWNIPLSKNHILLKISKNKGIKCTK